MSILSQLQINIVEEMSDGVVPIVRSVLMLSNLEESLLIHVKGNILLFTELCKRNQRLLNLDDFSKPTRVARHPQLLGREVVHLTLIH